MTRLWIRADGSADVGLGHVMRSLAVAEQAASRGIDVTWVTAGDPVVTGTLSVRDQQVRTLASADDHGWLEDVNGSDLVLFDGYRFTAHDYVAARRRAGRVGAVDDWGRGEFPVDVVLNPTTTDVEYATLPTTISLLGPRHALIRREFRGRRRGREAASIDCLLLTFGGTDLARLAPRAMELVDGCPFARVLLLVGPGSPAVDVAPDTVEVVRAPADVGAVFDQADAVVSAAGSTTWELLYLGVPAALVAVADNQSLVLQGALGGDAALAIGSTADFETAFPAAVADLAEPAIRDRLSTNAMALVDGGGAERLLDALLGVTPPQPAN